VNIIKSEDEDEDEDGECGGGGLPKLLFQRISAPNKCTKSEKIFLVLDITSLNLTGKLN
jgi:hypothetical protein